MRLKLTDGDRVCIIGGGPAGSFAALHLLHLGEQKGLSLDVTIFEPRDFSRPGPGGCNRCAGILSSRLLAGLESLGIMLPAKVIQAELQSYAAQFGQDILQLARPGKRHRIVSIYRGGGPRLFSGEQPRSFDGFLLAQAVSRGAKHVPRRVQTVKWIKKRPLLYVAGEQIPADLLVLATGVNSRPPLADSFGYTPPPTGVMAQDEILLPPNWPANQVRVYFDNPPGLIFGAIIPKGRYLNISLLGEGFTRDTVEDFIASQGLGEALNFTANSSLCGCTPRIAIGPAHCFCGDRWVAVGDAAVARLYKDGIGSAFYTAQAAMQTAVLRGVSGHAFRRGYIPYCRQIVGDNRYGRLLFRLWHLTLKLPLLLRVWQSALHVEKQLPPEQQAHVRILWGMFTGDDLYRDLFWLSVHPAALWSFLRGAWRLLKKRKETNGTLM